MIPRGRYDVVVVGGGNAALCAALEARRAGCSVAIFEAAPRYLRGGNSRHTRNLRYAHEGPDNFLVGTYSEEEFYRDLLQVTGGETDESLARFTIRASRDLGDWVKSNGVHWQGALKGTLQLNRTNSFFLGGGKALVNTYYQTAEALGVEAFFETPVVDILCGDEEAGIAITVPGGETRQIGAGAIVVASGGFEANLDWLGQYWGDAAQNFAIRGTAYNVGGPLRTLLDRGARAIGNKREFHAVAVDARGPKFDGGIVTRLDSVPFGIAVNKHAQRFSDEGADFWPKRYASWGGLIARQDDQIIYSITDAKMIKEFMPSAFPPIEVESIAAIGREFGLDVETLVTTVNEYNAAVRIGKFDPSVLDDCHTEGLAVPKSHWALPITDPPFYVYPLRPGITFTYYGVGVTERAQVLRDDGRPIGPVFAAGEIMAGNILGRGYLAGFGMTIGSVFGRVAGRSAAEHALD